MNPHRRCKNCDEMMELINGKWVHRYDRPLSLVLNLCNHPNPSTSRLEDICVNLLTEVQIKDAGQRNVEQYYKQLTDHLKEQGIEVEDLYSDEENENG